VTIGKAYATYCSDVFFSLLLESFSECSVYTAEGRHIDSSHSFFMSWAGSRNAIIVYYK
jgi:hypothetical protein